MTKKNYLVQVTEIHTAEYIVEAYDSFSADVAVYEGDGTLVNDITEEMDSESFHTVELPYCRDGFHSMPHKRCVLR